MVFGGGGADESTVLRTVTEQTVARGEKGKARPETGLGGREYTNSQ